MILHKVDRSMTMTMICIGFSEQYLQEGFQLLDPVIFYLDHLRHLIHGLLEPGEQLGLKCLKLFHFSWTRGYGEWECS